MRCRSQTKSNETIRSAEEVVYGIHGGRTKAFWQLYVDRGNLSHCVSKVPGTEVSTLSPLEWEVDSAAAQSAFNKLITCSPVTF